MAKLFKITALSESLAGEQSAYNPNNPDVRQWYASIQGQEQNAPYKYRQWLSTFYQYKTPETNFVDRTSYFTNLEYAKKLFNQFPGILSPEKDLLINAVMTSIDPDSAEGRQNKFVLLKDHYALMLIKKYFIDLKGTEDLSDKTNATKLQQARKVASENYEAWLLAREASLKTGKNWWTQWAKPILRIASVIVQVIPGVGTAAGLSLGALLNISAEAIDNMKLIGDEVATMIGDYVVKSTSSGVKVYAPGTDPGTGEAGFGWLPVALIGGLLFATMKGKK